MASLHAPLPTLRRNPRGGRRTARGQCGSLLLHRNGLAPSTPCRSPGALTVVLGRVDGFKEALTILSSAAGPLWGGRDPDWDDGGRLGGGCEAVSGLSLAAGRQGRAARLS